MQTKALCLGLTIYPLPIIPLQGDAVFLPKPAKYSPYVWEENAEIEIMETLLFRLQKFSMGRDIVYTYIETGDGSFSSQAVELEFFQKLVLPRLKECFE